MELTKYSRISPLVKENRDDGLDSDLPLSDVVDTGPKVVVIDALLRKHYVPVNSAELSEGTGLNVTRVSDALDAFIDAGIVTETENGKYQIDTENEQVRDLRDYQTSLLGE